MKKIRKKIFKYFLPFFQLFGRKRYMKHLMKGYAKLWRIEFADEGALFIASDVFFDDSEKISIGKNVTIASKTTILTHDYSIAYANMCVKKIDYFPCLKKKVIIGDNVFIGQNCFILPGVIIGDNSIIGACSVITKSIPPNSVYAGNPAKFICGLQEFSEKKLEKEKGNY